MKVFAVLTMLSASLLLGACGRRVGDVDGTPVSAGELADRVARGSAPVVLDVRTREEHARGHVPGAVNIPHDELATRLAELPAKKSDEIVVYCQSGRRAQLAEQVLRHNGYTNVRDLDGHWQGWRASELPAE